MAVITTLILTRHGEAHCNVAGIAGGDRACTGPDRPGTASGGTAREPLARRGTMPRAIHGNPTPRPGVGGNPVQQTRAARPHRAGPHRPAPRRCRRPSLERDQNRVRRAAVRTWPGRPDLRDAFLRGYPLSPAEDRLTWHLGAIDALTALARGHENTDPQLVAVGRNTLRQLREEP